MSGDKFLADDGIEIEDLDLDDKPAQAEPALPSAGETETETQQEPAPAKSFVEADELAIKPLPTQEMAPPPELERVFEPKSEVAEKPAVFVPGGRAEWERLRQQLEKELPLAEDPSRRADLLFSLGEILELALDETDKALNLYQQALAVQRQHLPAQKAATRLLRRRQKWENVVELLEAQESLATDKEKVQLLVQQAAILAAHLNKSRVAVERLERAMKLAPRDRSIFKLMETSHILSGDTGQLMTFYSRAIEDPAYQTERLELMQNLARLQEEHAHLAEEAITTYRGIVELDPGNQLALQALKRLLTQAKRWDDLMAVYRHEEAVTEDPKAKALLKYLQARLLSGERGERGEAVALLQRGMELDPANLLLLDELETVYESQGDWKELAAVRERQFNESSDPEKRIDIAFKLGALREDRLEDGSGAAIWYEQVLDLKPDYLPALHALERLYDLIGDYEKAVKVLRREAELTDDKKLKASKYFAIGELAARQTKDTELAINAYRSVLSLMPGYLPAIKALSELFAYLGRPLDLIEMNELQIQNNPNLTDEQFVYLLEKNASLWEHGGHYDHAAECHRRILERRPEQLSSIQALGRLYSKTKKWNDLVLINDREADLINDQHRIVALHYKSGEICETKLNDLDRAVTYYRRVLVLSPSYLPAVRALGGIFQRRGQWEDLIKMFQRELDALDDGDQAISIRFKIAEIYLNELKNPRRAETHYQKILELDPGFTPAMHALSELYQREGNHQALIDILNAQVERSPDHAVKLLALHKIAERYESGLGDLAQAEASYRRIMELDPDNLAARRGLFRLYAQRDDRMQQLDLLSAELKVETQPARRLPLLFAKADLTSGLAGRESETVECFRQILQIDPDDEAAFRELERLFRRQGRFDRLAELYETQLENAFLPAERLPLLSALADLLEHYSGDDARLAQVMAELLKLDALNIRALDYFEDRYARTKQWPELLDIHKRLRELTEDKTRLLHIYVSSAQIYELELGRPDEALKRYESVLSLDPACYSALQGAKRVYAKLEKWGDLLSLLEGELERAPSASAFIAVAYQLAHINETKFNRRRQATELFMKVLDLDPGHKDAYLRAQRLLAEDRNHQALFDIGERRLGVLEARDERLELHRALADLAETGLSNLAKAIEHRRKLVEADPEDLVEKRRLADLLARHSEWKDAITLYEQIAPRLNDTAALKELTFIMGRIYQDELKDLSRAVSAFETVLAYEPDDVQAMERLGQLYRDLKLDDEACDIMRKLLTHELPREREIRLNLALGEILVEQKNDPDQAAKHFERALALDPTNAGTIATLSALFERLGRWDRLIQMVEQNVEAVPEDKPDRKAGLLMGLARLHMDKMGDIDQALKSLERARVLTPENMEIAAFQAKAMGMNALYYLDAIAKHRELLAHNPFRVDSYQELFRIFTERKESDRAFCALQVLAFMKATNEEQDRLLHEGRERSGGGIAAALSERDQERLLVHPAEKGVLRDLFKALEPALYKLEPVDLEPYDLPNCKVAGVNSSLYHLLENAAYHLGVDLFRVYISQAKPDMLAVENTKPPTVIVGGSLAFASEGIKRFLSGMVMSRIRNAHIPFVSMSGPKLRFWAELTAQLYIPEVVVHQADRYEEVDDLASKLNRAISKTSRKELEEASRQFHKQSAQLDFERYGLALRHTENRMGLLLAGELSAAVECLTYLASGKPYRPPVATGEIAELFRHDETVKELMRFAVSEDYFELRKMVRASLD